MGLFGKENKESRNNSSSFSELPPLPELPDFPPMHDDKDSINQLPILPESELGEKFSQDIIKEAVTGKKEDIDSDADESEISNEFPRMPESFKRSFAKEAPIGFREAAKKVKQIEPVFVRLDKFEKAIHTFEQAQEKINEIEHTIQEIKKLKEKEEIELEEWENEIQNIKQQIEKIDSEIFSKIE